MFLILQPARFWRTVALARRNRGGRRRVALTLQMHRNDEYFLPPRSGPDDSWGKKRAEKRVPNQYHLSVLAVLLRALTLPSVPQNQRDTLA